MLQKKMSLSDIIFRNNGFSTGFDYLRIVLAIAVVAWHGIKVVSGVDSAEWHGSLRSLAGLMLPMFFSLSGFLVAGSLERVSGLCEFLLLRAIRIVPALAVEVLLSALILGACLTTLPLAGYITSDVFHRYFFNIVGHIQYQLPGVFEANPFPGIINLSLWTVPFELECYLVLSAMMLLGWAKRPWLVVAACLAAILLLTMQAYPLRDEMQYLRPKGKALILAFVIGVLVYQYRAKILYGHVFAAISALLALALLSQAWLQYLALPFVAYVTVYLGLQTPKKYTFVMRGDYSYGLYLFAFPLQQLHVFLFGINATWAGNVTFALCFGMLYAAFSWHCVEQPILTRRKIIAAFFGKTKAVSA